MKLFCFLVPFITLQSVVKGEGFYRRLAFNGTDGCVANSTCCVGNNTCTDSGLNGTAIVGNSSCIGDNACYMAGNDGYFHIGEGSCAGNATKQCTNAG